MKKQRMERGQVLVLIVLALVALFGFAALAVDIGRLYAERRRVQSAADAAALAAAFAASQSRDYVPAAISSFNKNDIVDTDLNENPDIEIDVEVYNPPVDGPYGPASDFSEEERNQYYQVYVRSQVDAVFSQIVYGGPLKVTVESTARYSTGGGFYDGDVLHALNTDVCNAIEFFGSSETTLWGGSAFSESTAGSGLDCTPGELHEAASCASASQNGSGAVNIIGGTLTTAGPFRIAGGASALNATGGVIECEDPRPPQTIREIDCTGMTPRTYNEVTPGIEQTIEPGYYGSGIRVANKKTVLNLQPGIYCLDGNLDVSGGALTGYGVLIYMDSGSASLTGGSFNVTAPNSATINPDSNDLINDYTGLLFFMPYHNNGTIHIGGNSTSEYTGTIYAPGPTSQPSSQYKCIIEGDGTSLGVYSNLICDTITVRGGAVVNIDYQEDAGYQMPPTIDLVQ